LRSIERNPLYFCIETNVMWRLIIILLLGFTLQVNGQQDTVNQLDSKGKKTGYWVSKDPSGVKVYEGYFRDGHPVGRFFRFHPNGKIRAEMNYQPDGMRVAARLYDTEAILRAEGVYLNQVKDGLWSFYSGQGKPIYRINYNKGKVHGEALRYDSNGTLLEQTHWTNNQLNGLQIIFYPDNKPQAKINYRVGNIHGPYQLLFPDGLPEVQGIYDTGLKTGKWDYFKPGGDKDYVLNYKNGKLLNPEILNARQRETFERYEKNKTLLKDPQDFLNNPEGLLVR